MTVYLPDEIWLEVIAYLDTHKARRQSLRQLSQCSSQLHRLCIPALWYRIDVSCSDPTALIRLMSLILKCRYITSCCQHLHFSGEILPDDSDIVRSWRAIDDTLPAALEEYDFDARVTVTGGVLPALLSLLVQLSNVQIISTGEGVLKDHPKFWTAVSFPAAEKISALKRIAVQDSCGHIFPFPDTLNDIKSLDCYFLWTTPQMLVSFFQKLSSAVAINPASLEELQIRASHYEEIDNRLPDMTQFTGLRYLRLPSIWLAAPLSHLDRDRQLPPVLRALPPGLRTLCLIHNDTSGYEVMKRFCRIVMHLLRAPVVLGSATSSLELIELAFVFLPGRVMKTEPSPRHFGSLMKTAVERSPPVEVSVIRAVYNNARDEARFESFSRLRDECGIAYSTALWNNEQSDDFEDLADDWLI